MKIGNKVAHVFLYVPGYDTIKLDALETALEAHMKENNFTAVVYRAGFPRVCILINAHLRL